MVGFHKVFKSKASYKAFPSSKYATPIGGRTSSLEKNILRYRSCEFSLFLFYAEDIKRFMINNVYRLIPEKEKIPLYKTAREGQLLSLLEEIIESARSEGRVGVEDGNDISELVRARVDDSKTLRKAFSFAIEIGLCSKADVEEIKQLIDYRNDIAHRTHKVMADLSNQSFVEELTAGERLYKGQAVERIRILRKGLLENSRMLPSMIVSFDSIIFEITEKFYLDELRRLDAVIVSQIECEKRNVAKLSDEIAWAYSLLQGEEWPRHPGNFAPPTWIGKEDFHYTNRLSRKGVELCYRFFDKGVSNMAVAYIMGLTLRSVERRRKTWMSNN